MLINCTMTVFRKSLFILAALTASCAVAYEARTVSITDTHYDGGLATSFDLAFGAGSAANALYVAYGSFDGGADPKAWQNLVKLADIAPGTSTYTAAAPTGWGTSVNALRFFMADIADLPYDAALEYVFTTGAEYADTGYLPTSNTSVAIDMAYINGNPSGSDWVPVWGYRKDSSNDKFALFIHKTANQFSFNYKTTDVKVENGLAVGERFIFRNDNARQYVTRVERGESEVLLGENVPDQTFAAAEGWTIALNGFRTSTSGIENRSLSMRIYGMKIWEGGVLQRDYVPCRMDGAVGLYDNVNKTLLTPVSSLNRSFAAGPTAVENGGFGAVSAIPATVFASGSAPSGSATRTVTVSATNRIAGAIVSLGLSFSPSYATNYLYIAYGAADGGDDPDDWDNLDFVKVVEPYETGATVPVPAGWGDAVLAMRLFLGAPPSKPYDCDVEWIATTGSQWFDTGAHLRYGQTFTYTWRQFGTTYLISNDAGWSTGSGSSEYWVVGGGVRNDNYIKVYLKGKWYEMSPIFATSQLTSDVIYRDECVVGATYSYTMTNVSTGASFVLSNNSIAPKDGSSYDSNSNIILGRNIDSNPIPGRKAIYRATLADTATGNLTFDLVPVVSNGVSCLYDLVSGAIVQNAGVGAMPQGPKVTPRLPSTSFDGSSATVSIIDELRVAAGEVSAEPGSYASVSIAFDVRALGGAAAVDVDVNYGPSADAMSNSARLASGVGLGAGSGTLPGLFPGRTYYAQLVASANNSASASSATFTFTCPSPESPAGGVFSRIISTEADGSNATVTFSPWSVGTIPLYVAYGADYGGERTNGWDNVVKVGDIAASTTSASVALPAGWGSTVRFLRFFLSDEVEFLDKVVTSGTQYIDTGLYPDRNFKAEVRAKVLSGSTISGDWFPLIGERRTSGTKFNLVLWLPKDPSNVNVHPSAGDQPYDIGDQSTGSAASNLKTYSFSVLDGLYADGALVSAPSKFKDTTKVADLTLRLFAMDNGGTIEARKFYGECEYFKAYTNSVLVQHLVPCAMLGVTNMFDLVTERVFANVGTGSFAGGSAVSNATYFSYSDIVIAPDVSSPVLGETAASGEWRGDRVTISGTLEGAGAGDCRIVVETSRLGDFTDVVTWEADGTYGEGDAFSVELFDADAASARYIVPGATTWYRVKAIDRAGTLDASVPASFTTQAAMFVNAPSISSDGKAFTVTVPVVTVGANTNWFWVVHSAGNALLDHATDKVEIPHDYAGATVTISGIADTSELATLNWAVVVSNDCSTAVWATTTPTGTQKLTNNLRYTWKKAVAAGNWEDAASWDAPAGRFNWPTVNSQAYFANATTAAVTIASSLLEVTDIIANTRDVDLTFTGDRTTRKLKANTFQVNDQGGRICVSNLAFEVVSDNDINVGQGRTLVFHDADVETTGYLGPRGGPDRHLVISGGSYVRSYGSIGVGGVGSDITIDDSYVDQYHNGQGFFFSSSADGGDIVLKGRNPRLETVSNFRSAQNRACGGRLVFVVPEGGFAETPVRQIAEEQTGKWDEARQFFSNLPQYVDETQPSEVVIDPASPALHGGALTQTLVEWRNGIAFDKTILGATPKPNKNRFVFSGGFDSHDDWTPEWTDTENAPCALGFSHDGRLGMVIVVQ